MTQRKFTGRMKKTAVWLLAMGVLCAPLPVCASAQSSSTTASVDFTSGSTPGPVRPVDPDRPDREGPSSPDWSGDEAPGGTPPERELITVHDDALVPASDPGPFQQIPGATGAAGWLSINYVTPLDYGTELEDHVYTVRQQRPYLQTSDLRGTASGWKVTAIASAFHDPGEGSPVPALLNFRDGSANSAHPSLHPPGIPPLIELPANGTTQCLIEMAEENEGVGVWVARWYPVHGAAHDFQLRLFAPVSDGTLGSVLWIMNDAP